VIVTATHQLITLNHN